MKLSLYLVKRMCPYQLQKHKPCRCNISVISESIAETSYLRPARAGRSLARQISSQLLSGSQFGSGLATLFCRPTPPVSRNINSGYSISFLALRKIKFSAQIQSRQYILGHKCHHISMKSDSNLRHCFYLVIYIRLYKSLNLQQ